MVPEKFKIFVSSTTQDLEHHRGQVCDLITALGLIDIAMERWPADFRPTIDVVDAALGESDIYVGLFAWRYGTRLQPDGISFTEHEYRAALDAKKPRLLYLLHPEVAVRPCHFDTGQDGEDIRRLRKEIEDDKSVLPKYFRSDWDLARSVVESLYRLLIASVKYGGLPIEERAVLELLRLTQEDFVTRTHQIESSSEEKPECEGEWFIAGIGRCNVGRFYIQRAPVRESVADWFLRAQTPFLFLVGPSGIGKTNFLIELIDRIAKKEAPLAQRAAFLLPLGQYDPARSFPDNLRDFLSHHRGLSPSITAPVLTSLIRQGDVLLILDGLDEFARNRSAEQCGSVFDELAHHLDGERSRVVVSCRDHIYKRLRGSGLFVDPDRYQRVDVPFLTADEVETALRSRIARGGEAILRAVLRPPLLDFAKNPLLLEMMCRFKVDSWKQLLGSRTKGQLYDLWFEEIIVGSADDLSILDQELISATRAKVGKIATLMVQTRSDLIAESTLAAHGIPVDGLQALTRQPFGILVKETSDEWGFVHGSLREFALGKKIAAELLATKYDLLASEPQLDYVGAEPQQFLRDLFRNEAELFGKLEEALDSDAEQRDAWNNIAWNVFETVGNIGTASAGRFIDRALDILAPRKHRGTARHVSYRTQQNIVRALERLHESAPRPYCDYVIARAWPLEPDRENFGALAIRGFHMEKPHPGSFPPMSYRMSPAQRDSAFKQEAVSDCLLTLLEDLAVGPPDEGKTYLEINCTFALIRWLHRSHADRAKALLQGLSSGARGNLFQAFLRFEAPDMLRGSSELFRGMTLSWCRIDESTLPDGFVFHGVRFEQYKARRVPVRAELLSDDCTFV